MPNAFRDHRELDDDNDLALLRNKLPEGFGNIQYLVAFNEKGRELLFTGKGIPVEETEREDNLWRDANEALALWRDPKYIYDHVRIGRVQDDHGMTVTFEYSRCHDGNRCTKGTFFIPKDMLNKSST